MTKILLHLIICFTVITCTSCKAQATNIIAPGAKLTMIDNGFEFTEGPASDKIGNVYFTDQPNNKILKWNAANNEISTFMEPAGRSNGLYFDDKGNLLAAADEYNQLWQISMDGKVDTLITDFEGKKLNGPNDLWIDAKGGIYFTDPYYQRPYWKRTTPEITEKRVYYWSPVDKSVSIAAKGFVQPNGIIGSADGTLLYIADIGENKTYSFLINSDGSLTNKKLFADLGSDGMTMDNQGNVYLTGDGVSIFNANGKKLTTIVTGEKWTANVTFGGLDQNILFITAMGAVYTLKMNVNGTRYLKD